MGEVHAEDAGAGVVSPERFMITGASGMIGAAFSAGLKLTRQELDVTSEQDVKKKVAELKPTAILHLANLDMRQCQKDPLLAVRTNIHATQYFIEVARENKVPLVFVSSASIFCGEKGESFDEESLPRPLHLYGEAKVISEKMILNQYPEGAIVVRTGWVFGGHGAHHRKFVDATIEKARKNETVFATQDYEGSPVYVKDLVAQMMSLITQKKRGVYHIANSGAATPWEMAECIIKRLESPSKISPLVPSFEESGIQRSHSEVIQSKYFKLRPWREALNEYVSFKIKNI